MSPGFRPIASLPEALKHSRQESSKELFRRPRRQAPHPPHSLPPRPTGPAYRLKEPSETGSFFGSGFLRRLPWRRVIREPSVRTSRKGAVPPGSALLPPFGWLPSLLPEWWRPDLRGKASCAHPAWTQPAASARSRPSRTHSTETAAARSASSGPSSGASSHKAAGTHRSPWWRAYPRLSSRADAGYRSPTRVDLHTRLSEFSVLSASCAQSLGFAAIFRKQGKSNVASPCGSQTLVFLKLPATFNSWCLNVDTRGRLEANPCRSTFSLFQSR